MEDESWDSWIDWGSSHRALEWEGSQYLSHCSGVGAKGCAEVPFGWQLGPSYFNCNSNA